MAKRAAARRINLPSRSLRTVSRGAGVSRRRLWGGKRVLLLESGSSGGLGLGGLGGSSEGVCRWPSHHNAYSSQVWNAAFSGTVSTRWLVCSRHDSKQVLCRWYERQTFGRAASSLSAFVSLALPENFVIQSACWCAFGASTRTDRRVAEVAAGAGATAAVAPAAGAGVAAAALMLMAGAAFSSMYRSGSWDRF